MLLCDAGGRLKKSPNSVRVGRFLQGGGPRWSWRWSRGGGRVRSGSSVHSLRHSGKGRGSGALRHRGPKPRKLFVVILKTLLFLDSLSLIAFISVVSYLVLPVFLQQNPIREQAGADHQHRRLPGQGQLCALPGARPGGGHRQR